MSGRGKRPVYLTEQQASMLLSVARLVLADPDWWGPDAVYSVGNWMALKQAATALQETLTGRMP